MSSSAQVRAWNAFWEEQGPESRCLRSAPDEIHRLLCEYWKQFAGRLPMSTQVLDIGCGTGTVGWSLVQARPDLRIVGIDIATVPVRSDDPRIQICPGIATEALPFPDTSFGAAVSQFGLEYSNVPLATQQLARVLKSGARLSFVVHHSDSPIVEGDRAHSAALKAAMSELIRAPFLSGDTSTLRRQLQRLQSQFPDETTLWLLTRGLLERISATAGLRQRLWNAVTEALVPDCILGDALEASCVAPGDLGDWLAPLRKTFRLENASALMHRNDPIAWRIEAVKA